MGEVEIIMTVFIGLTGKAGSGKDTACEEIRNMYSGTSDVVTSFALADPLKLAAASLFGVDITHFYRNKEDTCPAWGITYRTMLQKLGTEFARNLISQDFWTTRATQTYKEIVEEGNPDLIICTDVRFDNEAKWVSSHNGVLIEIKRDNKLLGGGEEQHSSEAGVSLDYIDHVVYNNGTITELNSNLINLMLNITGK